MSQTLSVQEVCKQIAEAIQNSFDSEVWVEGVLSSLRRSQSGHVYFDLVDSKESLGSDTKSVISVTLFATQKQHVNKILIRSGGATKMEDGIKVRIRGAVNYYAPAGKIQLIMSLIDPEYTLGQMAADRDRLLKYLETNKLIGKNALLEMPLTPTKVALVTSLGSAAFVDFTTELESSGFNFDVETYDCRTQGADAVPTIVNAIETASTTNADAIVLIRGGGSRSDLVAFDHKDIAMAIAMAKKPVITGIGHEIDTSIADAVSHTTSKTPTAAATFLIGQMQAQVAHLNTEMHRLNKVASSATQLSLQRLETLSANLQRACNAVLSDASGSLDQQKLQINNASGSHINRAKARLEASGVQLKTLPIQKLTLLTKDLETLDARAKALDPVTTLERGWTITRTDAGELVRNPQDVQTGTRIVTTTAKGDVDSVVD